jgi:DNA-binding HxlR family transcriptional regulator
MYKPKLTKDIRCPLEYGLDLFGGKWKSRIICVLAHKKTLRYSEVRKEMHNVTDAALAATLKELQQAGIIRRQQFEEIPPRVEYQLTEKGCSIVPILQSICKWSGIYYRSGSKQELTECQKCDYGQRKGD